MSEVQIKAELVALFTPPTKKETKASYLMPLRYALQDYLAWKKAQPAAAKALAEIFQSKANLDIETMYTKDNAGKVIIPDTRTLQINDEAALKLALDAAKELKAAYKAAVEQFKNAAPKAEVPNPMQKVEEPEPEEDFQPEVPEIPEPQVPEVPIPQPEVTEEEPIDPEPEPPVDEVPPVPMPKPLTKPSRNRK